MITPPAAIPEIGSVQPEAVVKNERLFSMYLLEHEEPFAKVIKDAAGLCNSTCVMLLHTTRWKTIAVCEDKEPLETIISKMPIPKQMEYRIHSNQPEVHI